MLVSALVIGVALFFALMGVVGLVRPERIVALVGISHLSLDGRNEIRDVYGGFGIAVPALQVAALRAPTWGPGAFLAVALALFGMAAGRVVSMAVDRRIGGYPVLFFAGEVAMGAVTAVGLRAARRRLCLSSRELLHVDVVSVLLSLGQIVGRLHPQPRTGRASDTLLKADGHLGRDDGPLVHQRRELLSADSQALGCLRDTQAKALHDGILHKLSRVAGVLRRHCQYSPLSRSLYVRQGVVGLAACSPLASGSPRRLRRWRWCLRT